MFNKTFIRSLLLLTFIALPFTAHAQTDFALKSVTGGKTFDLAEKRGRVVVASFGATWCGLCAVELQAIEALRQEYQQKPVEFVWISVDDEETSNARVRYFARQHVKTNVTAVRDATGETFARYATRGKVPTLIVFDKRGEVAAPAIIGIGNAEEFKNRLRGVIDELLKTEQAAKQD